MGENEFWTLIETGIDQKRRRRLRRLLFQGEENQTLLRDFLE
jgi:hypothetical protein